MYNDLSYLKEKTPAAFRTIDEGGDSKVSQQYVFMTTEEIITMLTDRGWGVYSAMQQKTKKDPATAKHMLRFRNNEFGSLGVNGNIPEILLVNSHDRTSSLNFHVGLFRLICSNGLVVADKTFENINIPHIRQNFEDVKVELEKVTGSLPRLFQTINYFEHKMLTPTAQRELAIRGVAVRYPEYNDPNTGKVDFKKVMGAVDIDNLLKPLRVEDQNNDLWTVFNRVQEKIVKGGFDRIGINNTKRATKGLTQIRANIMINKGLWQLAEQFA
jgi:hypothetical protein